MRLLKTAFILPLLFAALFSASAQTQEWHKYTSERFGFSALFPDEPTVEEKNIPAPPGKKSPIAHIISFDNPEDGAPNITYMISYMEISANSVHSSNADEVKKYFDGWIDGITGNGRGKLLSQKTIEQQGFEGREAQVSMLNNTMIMTTRAFLVQNYSYTIAVLSIAEYKDNEDVARFLDSFTFVEKK